MQREPQKGRVGEDCDRCGKQITAKDYSGFGTALKPAHEPIVLARKPFKGTVAQNVLEHGTGGVNIDGCRVPCEDKAKFPDGEYTTDSTVGAIRPVKRASDVNVNSRFPANLIHDGSPEATAGMGNAAKYFYSAKASKKDRDEGLEALDYGDFSADLAPNPKRKIRPNHPRKNIHPTVKPTALMAYLCRLITPPGGTVLDPFMGSGSTGKAAVQEGFDFVGIEMDPEYLDIATARIAHAVEETCSPA